MWHKDEEEKKRRNNNFLTGMKNIGEAMAKNMWTVLETYKGQHVRATKLVKPAKVPGWTKEMKLDMYLKALEVWMEMNKDISEGVRFQDII